MPARKPHVTGNPGRPPLVPSPVLRLQDAVAYLTLRSHTSIYKLTRTDPGFPRPRKIGGATVWLRAELDDWLKNGAPIALLQGEANEAEVIG